MVKNKLTGEQFPPLEEQEKKRTLQVNRFTEEEDASDKMCRSFVQPNLPKGPFDRFPLFSVK